MSPASAAGAARLDRRVEGGDVGDMMVARAHQQQVVGVGGERGERDRRGAVALHRLEDQDARPSIGASNSRQLGRLRLVGDDDRRAEPRRSSNRASVCSNRLASPISGSKCFGLAAVDIGHSRVPAPPARITGRIGRHLCHATHTPSLAQSRAQAKVPRRSSARSPFICKVLRHSAHVGRFDRCGH